MYTKSGLRFSGLAFCVELWTKQVSYRKLVPMSYKFIPLPLRAYPPTRLHATQFLRSAANSQRNFLAAQFLFFLANRGGPRGGPRAPCKRPRAKGPKGPKGPSGPLGQGALRAPGPLRGPGGPLIRNKSYAERNR